MSLLPQSVDVLGSRIPVLPTVTPKARAWAQVIREHDHLTSEGLASLVQTLITEERNHVLLCVEKALVQEMK